ncbi:cytochrome c oxidase subunit 2A [Cytobacillus solani]|uniref:Subunit I/II of b(O/a)3-type cytochrome C oxidase n=1 Tax=Cytobacillus solani TaxID=1637975 RepID=A0A0Q3VIK0_9BACI|nr:cytochrome c oxidase subunit 2A [Cytobacillus solani]KOP83175.1 subunit I/II of b(o/a)3-type cytochrome C oxidase [Bacillus sp. FJAT-21945]KQL20202.1 subunit I/II of b(o/a)3-type cytochrome C oxidase [Cytobacillus solani]USK53455.1 cytochrome c oxidase subunit 2A [Cytobacillus solani]
MAKTELNRKIDTETEVEDSTNLNGTLASVMILGAILIITWVGLYMLFLSR